MKETLYQRIRDILLRIEGKIIILQRNIKDYKKENDFENAMKCDIKKTTFEMIAKDLEKELNT